MECIEAARLIESALTGAMDDEALAPLIDHLERCERCRSEVDGQMLVKRILASRPPDVLPDGFADRLSARLTDERPASWLDATNWRVWSLRLLPAAAALLGFALVFDGSNRPAASTDLSSAIVAWGMHESGMSDPIVAGPERLLEPLPPSAEQAAPKRIEK